LDAPVTLEENDIRRMVHLVSEVVTVPGNHAAKKRFLMDGLCQLIGADAWAWTLSCQSDPDKPQVLASFLNGGLSEERLAKVLQAVEHPDMVKIAAKFFTEIKEKRTHLTRLRFQITNRKQYEPTGAHLAWKEANIGPVIMSLRPLDDRSGSLIVLYRNYDREEFSVRESRIAHIILTEVSWLHEQGWPEDRGVDVPKLSRRQRLTLNLLTLGQNRKQIASNMGISVHTAQGYIKEVYRYFRVSSQGELMSRFLQGNGQHMI
jgi:DNA-binding CsgD family transcriptional regulator